LNFTKIGWFGDTLEIEKVAQRSEIRKPTCETTTSSLIFLLVRWNLIFEGKKDSCNFNEHTWNLAMLNCPAKADNGIVIRDAMLRDEKNCTI